MENYSITLLQPNYIVNIFIILSIGSTILLLMTNNPMQSILYLIFLFVNIAIYLCYIGIPLLGLLYILVYVGAIAILFLFILSLLNLNVVELIVNKTSKNWLIILIFSYLMYIISNSLVNNNLKYLNIYTVSAKEYIGWYERDILKTILNLDVKSIYYTDWYGINQINELTNIGILLYTEYSVFLIILAIILLLSIIGSIVIVSTTLSLSNQR